VPVLLLAIAVGVVVSAGSSLVDLVGSNPPPLDEFEIRRVEFQPGEIRIVVGNPQRDDLSIANVNVDDAIVPFTVDGATTLGRLRSSTIVVPFDWVEGDPLTVGGTSCNGRQPERDRDREGGPGRRRDAAAVGEGVLRLHADRAARGRAADRARPALAA